MRVSVDGTSLTIDLNAAAIGNRRCGTCSLCCKLLPVPPLAKPAGHRCKHSRHGKGCGIYARRPAECRDWSCRWLAEAEETKGLRWPDHAHYVVDNWPDRISLRDKETGDVHVVAVVQVWIDPAFRHVKDDPALRAYLEYMAERPRRMAGLLRFGSHEAIVIAAPSMSLTGEWYEDPAPTLTAGGMFALPERLAAP